MTWTPNAATIRLQAIKSGKNPREAETKPVKTVKKAAPAKKKRIKQNSKKRARQLRKYTKLRKVFLEEHTECEIPVEGCTTTATEVHHAAGRENELLLDVKGYKAACNNCHRVATDKSKEAIADGRSKSRHTKKR